MPIWGTAFDPVTNSGVPVPAQREQFLDQNVPPFGGCVLSFAVLWGEPRAAPTLALAAAMALEGRRMFERVLSAGSGETLKAGVFRDALVNDRRDG